MSQSSDQADVPGALDQDRGRVPEFKALRPVTVRQLREAKRAHTTANFTIDGIEVSEVTIVAHVIRINVTDAGIRYTLVDGTGSSHGSIIAFQRHSEAGERLDQSDEGRVYARVQGPLSRFARSMNPQNELMVNHIRKVTDPHEVYFHLLEAFMATLYIDIGPPPSSVLRGIRAPSATARDPNSSQFHDAEPSALDISLLDISTFEPQFTSTQFRPDSGQSPPESSPRISQAHHASVSGPSTGDSSGDASGSSQPAPRRNMRRISGRDPLSHLSNLQRGIILGISNASPSPHGISVGTIAGYVISQGPTSTQIAEALEYLINEEYIHATIDEHHYALTRRSNFDVQYATL